MYLTRARLCYWLNKLKDDLLRELLPTAISPKLNSANKCKLKISTLHRRCTNGSVPRDSWAASSAARNSGNKSKTFTLDKYSKMSSKEYNGSTAKKHIYSAHYFLENSITEMLRITGSVLSACEDICPHSQTAFSYSSCKTNLETGCRLSRSDVWLSANPRLLYPWDSPGKNTGVSSHSLLQGSFPTWESNPRLLCLLHWQAVSLPLSHLGSLRKQGKESQIHHRVFTREKETKTFSKHLQVKTRETHPIPWKSSNLMALKSIKFPTLFNLSVSQFSHPK